MALTSRKNQYRAINVHLNSLLQQKGGDWESFHTNHISDIHAQLNEQLEGTGYVTRIEKGVQIRFGGDSLGNPESDLLIWDKNPSRFASGAATLALSRPEWYKDTEYFKAITIYHRKKDEIPVAWIELLSPSNKKGGRHYAEYLKRRDQILATESCSFIEIDYLHQSSPTIHPLADYTRQGQGATPYRVSIIDTRISIKEGKLYVAHFSVDEIIPIITIPLHGQDLVDFNLHAAYQATFTRIRYGKSLDTLIDYQQIPPNFDTYRLSDQQKILKRMLAVMDAANRGVDLEGAAIPLEIEESRLQTLLAQGELTLPETVTIPAF